jgi:transposase
LLQAVRRSPRLSGVERSRWSLAALLAAVLWLGGLTVSGAGRLLGRLGVRYRRGQAHLHSPDPGYDAKLRAVALARDEAKADPGRVAFLYQDEHTCYRRPSVAQAWQAEGGPGRPAEQGHKANTARRLIAALDARDGRLICWRRSRADRATLARYYKAVAEAYPDAEVIYLAQDNWPVHFHDDVLRSLEGGRLKLLRLPTYAPWTNPVEKVWRKLKQEVTHQHDFGDDNAALNAAVDGWLAQHAHGSAELLRYVGLHPD